MNFKYFNKFFNNSETVDVYLYAPIGGDEGIDAQRFADELNYIANYTSVKKVNVRINSEGGEVIKGIGIFSCIVNLNKSGRVQVDTYNDGVAASISGIIFMGGKERYMKHFARTMIHGVSAGEEKDLTQNDKDTLAMYTALLNEIFAANSKTKSDVFTELLTNKKDNWFNISQCLNMGIATKEEADELEAEAESVISGIENNAPELRRRITTFYNKQHETKKPDMKKVFATLGIDSASTEENAVTGIEKLKQENESLKNELQTLKSEKEASDNEAAVTEVKNAIQSGKFKNESETELVEQAKKDLPGFRKMVASMNTPAANILGGIKPQGGTKTLKEMVNGRSLREVEKKDPALYDKILNTDKKYFAELYNEQYNTAKAASDF